MSELLKLAALCEQADGPSLDLDHAIHDLFPDGDGAPLYTRSLDAAMTLVPEGWAYKIGRTWCELWPVSSELTDEQWPEGWDDDRQHIAATPALALCAAVLRARAKDPSHAE